MGVVTQILTVGHVALLSLFVSATLLMLLGTVFNRLRVRRVLCAWHAQDFRGLPLRPLLFLAGVAAAMLASAFFGHAVRPVIWTLYLTGGVFWLCGALLAGTLVVTEFGIIRSVNRLRRSVAWGQIADYFSVEEGRCLRYVFFYHERSGRRRFELTVPPAHRARFQHTIAQKLDARFNFTVEQAYGKKTLNS